MERLNQHLFAEAAKEFQMALCAPNGCLDYVADRSATVYEARSRPLWLLFVSHATGALRLAVKKQPRFVLAGSGLMAPIAWLAGRMVRARVGVYLHGLDVIVPNLVYQSLWLPLIRRCDFVFVNSEHTRQLALSRGVKSGAIRLLRPGVSLPDPTSTESSRFAESDGLQNRIILLSVGRLSPRKGLKEFVENCLPAIVKRNGSVVLVHIGSEASEALYQGGGSQRALVEQAAERMGVSANVMFMGALTDSALQAAYRSSSVHIFPVLASANDVEGFGMVAIEAASHGLPTVAFGVGGVPEAVADQVSGFLVPDRDYGAFAEQIEKLIASPWGAAQKKACRDFAHQFAWPRFGERLRELLHEQAEEGQ